MIYISGIVISLFLSALLLLKKNRSRADNYLFAWMLLIVLHQMYFYFDHSEWFRKYTFLIGFDFPFPLLHGPLLFLYASALVGTLPRNRIRILHFIPALLCLFCLTGFYLLPGDQKLYIIDHDGLGYELFLQIRFIAIIASGIIYVVLTLLLLNRHQRRIRDNFSDIEKINLRWLQYLTYGIGGIWLVVIFGNEPLTFLAVVIFVVFIGVYGIRQTPVFSADLQNTLNKPDQYSVQSVAPAAETNSPEKEILPEIPLMSNDPEPEKGKYQKSGLDDQDLERIHQKLEEMMRRDKLFTDPEVTLGDIARRLDIHPNYLSQVINAVLKKNFYDYINFQRVEEFKLQAGKPENSHFTLLSLAFSCGFNSKSSFNRNFRKVTGTSPSEYLRQIHVTLENADA